MCAPAGAAGVVPFPSPPAVPAVTRLPVPASPSTGLATAAAWWPSCPTSWTPRPRGGAPTCRHVPDGRGVRLQPAGLGAWQARGRRAYMQARDEWGGRTGAGSPGELWGGRLWGCGGSGGAGGAARRPHRPAVTQCKCLPPGGTADPEGPHLQVQGPSLQVRRTARLSQHPSHPHLLPRQRAAAPEHGRFSQPQLSTDCVPPRCSALPPLQLPVGPGRRAAGAGGKLWGGR